MTMATEDAQANQKRWLAHICCHPDCDHVEIDGSQNHAQYLCYANKFHTPGAMPMRPVYLVLDAVQPSEEQARGIREHTAPGWRRPSQHFERRPDTDSYRTFLTQPLPDEDWPGWPQVDARECILIGKTDQLVG
jgi:hypothetical protein